MNGGKNETCVTIPKVVGPRSIVAVHEDALVPTSPSNAVTRSGDREPTEGRNVVVSQRSLCASAACVVKEPVVHVRDVPVTAVTVQGELQMVTDCVPRVAAPSAKPAANPEPVIVIEIPPPRPKTVRLTDVAENDAVNVDRPPVACRASPAPGTVTRMGYEPTGAPTTTHTTVVAPQDAGTIVQAEPPIVTVVAAMLAGELAKPVPVMVSVVPGGPERGVALVIVGVSAVEYV